jgi:hypothetical protein
VVLSTIRVISITQVRDETQFLSQHVQRDAITRTQKFMADVQSADNESKEKSTSERILNEKAYSGIYHKSFA